MARMSAERVASAVQSMARQAINSPSGDVSTQRLDMLDAYRGETPAPGPTGQSSYNDRSVFETVEWTMPTLVRRFLGSHAFASFRPRGPEDEARAAEETEVVLYYLRSAPDAFTAWYDLFKSILMDPNGYAKVYHESWIEASTEEYTGLQPEEVMAVLEPSDYEGDVELLDLTPNADNTYDMRIECTKEHRAIRMRPIPASEVRVDPAFHGLDLDEADYVIHVRYRTRADLIRDGVPKAFFNDIGEGRSRSTFENEEPASRSPYIDEDGITANGAEEEPGLARYEVHEFYGRLDVNGDGFPERRKIIVIEGKLYSNDEDHYQPFVAGTAIRVPFLHVGQSYAEIAYHSQRVKSMITRQILDNAYAVNDRRCFYDDSLFFNNKPGLAALEDPRSRWIPVKGAPQGRIQPDPTPSIIGELAPVLELLDQDKQRRTGVAPNVSLDPQALQRVATDALGDNDARANERIEMLVRVLAETLVAKIMVKGHELIRRHYDRKLVIKLRNQWTQIDPTSWRQRTDVTVDVGLGHPNPDRRLQMLTQVYALQGEAMAANLATLPQRYALLSEIVQAAGLQHAEKYFSDPKAPGWQPPQPPPPDPVMLAQAEAFKAQAAKLQAEAARTGQDAAIKGQVEMAKLAAEREKQAAESERARLDVEAKRAEIELARYRAQQELAGKPQLTAAQIAKLLAETQKIDAETGAVEDEGLAKPEPMEDS